MWTLHGVISRQRISGETAIRVADETSDDDDDDDDLFRVEEGFTMKVSEESEAVAEKEQRRQGL